MPTKANRAAASVTTETLSAAEPPPHISENDAFSRSNVDAILSDQRARNPTTWGEYEARTDPATDPPPPEDGGDLTTSEGYRCATDYARDDFAARVARTPYRFDDTNLGIIVHDVAQIDRVWFWQGGLQVPAGFVVVAATDLVHRAARRDILGRENVG